MEGPFNNTSSPPQVDECVPMTDEELQLYTTVSWWLDGLLQTLLGSIGFLANALAIPILCSKEMNSIFNKLLVFLAVFDNVYIVCSVLEGLRKHKAFSQVHEYAFGYFLYPLHNFVLCCSIYITVTLALERFRAVWRPVEYHNKCKGANPWARVTTTYIIPVLIFSVVFNIPKLLEVEFVVKSFEDGNRTLASPTKLRLDDYYVIFYVNAARLLVQGIIPFSLLSFLNYRIYWVIRRRREMVNRPSCVEQVSNNTNTAAKAAKANETQQAIVLFIIVLLFFICHTPRFALNVHEFLTLDSFRFSIENDCNSVSVWALIWASVSVCLMTLNSSVNFFIYCFMCGTFRRQVRKTVCRYTPSVRRRSDDSNNADFRMENSTVAAGILRSRNVSPNPSNHNVAAVVIVEKSSTSQSQKSQSASERNKNDQPKGEKEAENHAVKVISVKDKRDGLLETTF